MNEFQLANNLKLLSDQALNETRLADPMSIMSEKNRRAELRGEASRYAGGGILDLINPDVRRTLSDPKVQYAAMQEAKKKSAKGTPPLPEKPPLFMAAQPPMAPGLTALPPLQPAPRLAEGGQIDLYQYLQNSRGHVDGLNPEFRARLERMYAAAPPDIRPQLGIRSGYRSPEHQAQLYKDAIAKYGSEEAARKWVAPPGRSNHNHGSALDFAYGADEARKWAHANAGAYGLNFRMSHEPWHIEMAKAQQAGAAPVPPGPIPPVTPSVPSAPPAKSGFDSFASTMTSPQALMAMSMMGVIGGQGGGGAVQPHSAPQQPRRAPEQSDEMDYAAESKKRELELMKRRNALLASYQNGGM